MTYPVPDFLKALLTQVCWWHHNDNKNNHPAKFRSIYSFCMTFQDMSYFRNISREILTFAFNFFIWFLQQFTFAFSTTTTTKNKTKKIGSFFGFLLLLISLFGSFCSWETRQLWHLAVLCTLSPVISRRSVFFKTQNRINGDCCLYLDIFVCVKINVFRFQARDACQMR